MGDSIATNLFMVGFAYQRGLLPLGEPAIMRAIELNGAAIESNVQSFRWGRLAAVDPKHVESFATPTAKPDSQRLYYVERQHPFAHATLRDDDVSIDFTQHTSPQDKVAVVVSAPLTTNETWLAFAPGELKVFEGGVLSSH